MDITSEVTLTAVVVVLGRWMKYHKWPDVKFIVGSGFYLLFLTAMAESQPKLAQRIGALVLITSILIYFEAIAKGSGLTKAKKKK